jgi:hypothetical protein
MPGMISAWEPTPAELAALNAGNPSICRYAARAQFGVGPK